MIFKDVEVAWEYLYKHKIFQVPIDENYSVSWFTRALDIQIVKVNPDNDTLEDNKELNTKIQVWLECGPINKEENKYILTHDYDLDTGADTFEDAILLLANKVKEIYG